MPSEHRYLNLGCGTRFHPAWINLDVALQHPSVQRHDVRKALPFDDNTFAAVYHSHLLEHLPRSEAPQFLHDCYRVLRPGGVLRVVAPDLEQIARLYLQALDRAAAGDEMWAANYKWLVLEMYDQTVRQESGGEMSRYLSSPQLVNRSFVLERMGREAASLFAAHQETSRAPRRKQPLGRRLLRELRRAVSKPRNWLLKLLLGSDYAALQLGRFRLAGEVHQWMYDRYSLAELLRAAGFVQPHVVSATTSAIPDWLQYRLDVETDNRTSKPDSLFMEAIKPARTETLGAARLCA